MGERGIGTHYVQGREKGKQRALASLLGEDYMIFRGVHWLEKHNIQDSPFGLWVWCHLWTCFQTLEGGSHSYSLFFTGVLPWSGPWTLEEKGRPERP